MCQDNSVQEKNCRLNSTTVFDRYDSAQREKTEQRNVQVFIIIFLLDTFIYIYI